MSCPAPEPLTGLPEDCSRGHHCGIRSSAEGGYSYAGHCRCPECRCPLAPAWPSSMRSLGDAFRRLGRRAPMCGLPEEET